jgi:hypothetical protein
VESILLVQSRLQVFRRADNQIHCKWGRGLHSNLYRLIVLIASGHHNQDINVAISMGLAVGVGTKQNDLFRSEPLGDRASVSAYHRLRNIGAPIPGF